MPRTRLCLILATVAYLSLPATGLAAEPAAALTDSVLAMPSGASLPMVDESAGAAVASQPATLDPAQVPTEDAAALVVLIMQLVSAKNWLLAVPVFLVLLLLGVRRLGAKWWPWLDTPKGGAVLSLVSAAALAVIAAAGAPGSVGASAVIVAALGLFLTNELTHKALKTLLWPDGKERAQEADAKGAALEASSKSPAAKVNEAVRG